MNIHLGTQFFVVGIIGKIRSFDPLIQSGKLYKALLRAFIQLLILNDAYVLFLDAVMILHQGITELFRDFVMSPELPVHKDNARLHALGQQIPVTDQGLVQLIPEPGVLAVVAGIP